MDNALFSREMVLCMKFVGGIMKSFIGPRHTITCLSAGSRNVWCRSNEKRSFFPLRLLLAFIKSHIKTDTHWKLLWWHQKFILRKAGRRRNQVREKEDRFLSKFRRKFFFSFLLAVYLFFVDEFFGGLRCWCLKRSMNECSSYGDPTTRIFKRWKNVLLFLFRVPQNPFEFIRFMPRQI